MPTPTPGQKVIPLNDWKRFLRVADWYERTVEQGKGVLGPTYGQSLIVKTPEAGIDARDGATIFSATCRKCVAAETATPGEKTLHETSESLIVYNFHTADAPGDTYVNTALAPNGTRYVETALVKQTVITEFRVDGPNKTLDVKTRYVWVMPEDDESEWTTIHTGDDCP